MSNNIYITYNIGTQDAWSTKGNEISNGVLGTKNDEGFDIITNDTPRISLSNEGEVGINSEIKTGVTLNVKGQVYADVFSGPQLITNNIIIPESTNSLLIGPTVSIETGFTITVGVDSFLTLV